MTPTKLEIKLRFYFAIGLMLYLLYPFLDVRSPFIVIGITPVNVPNYEGYRFVKDVSSPQFKKAVKQYHLDEDVKALYLPINEMTSDKPFSTVMVISNPKIMIPLISFHVDTHWKWERYAKEQLIKSYGNKCAVKRLGMEPNSLSYMCGQKSTAILFIQNQIVNFDIYSNNINEKTASFTKQIVNTFLSINKEDVYFGDKESLLLMFLYGIICLMVYSLVIIMCLRHLYGMIIFNLVLAVAFFALLYSDADNTPISGYITINTNKINLPYLGNNFDLPDTDKIINPIDKKSVIASISAKTESPLYPLSIYFVNLNQVGVKTFPTKYSHGECYHPHCHDRQFWFNHFNLITSMLPSASNIEILEKYSQFASQKVLYLQKNDLGNTDIILTSVLYLNLRVFELSIVKPYKEASDIETVMQVSDQVEESLFKANKGNGGYGNDATTGAFLALIIAFLLQFPFMSDKKKALKKQQALKQPL